MTLRNKDFFMEALWDWGILAGCFGQSKIAPTDIDGLVERKGKFLLIEAKSPGKDVPLGQQIMFTNLKKTGVFTIMIIWGEPNKPEKLQIWQKPPIKATIEIFREKVTDWYKTADESSIALHID